MGRNLFLAAFGLRWFALAAVLAGLAQWPGVACAVVSDPAAHPHPEEEKGDKSDKEADSVNKEKEDKQAKDKQEESSTSKEGESAKDKDSDKGGDGDKKDSSAADKPEKTGGKESSADKSDAKDAKDKEKSDGKADKEKAAKAKKPETYKVKTKRLKIETESDGVFIADEFEEVALRPEEWATFKVEEAVAHGAAVRQGEMLVKFDVKDFDKALADKALEQRLGEVALLELEEEFPRLEKSVNLDLEVAQRDNDQIVEEYKRFQKTMRPLSEKIAGYNLKSAEQERDNAREELDQLNKMYQADDLTEETEEIVLKRQKFQVEIADFYVEYSKINHEYTMNIAIPQRDVSLQTAVEQARLALERAKTAKTLGLSEKRYELEAARQRRTRSVEDHAKLVGDRALMTLRAPCDGAVYYGKCVNGRWGEVSGYVAKFVPFGSITPGGVIMTIVKERPLRVETSIGEKEVVQVKAGQTVTLVPAADAEVELSAKVKEIDSIPGSANQFTVQVQLGGDELPTWLKPGMTCKTKVLTYEAENAVVIPADLVQAEEDDPKARYVMVHVEDEEKPVRRDVKLGHRKEKEVEIVKGLKAGDLIVQGAKDKADDDDEK